MVIARRAMPIPIYLWSFRLFPLPPLVEYGEEAERRERKRRRKKVFPHFHTDWSQAWPRKGGGGGRGRRQALEDSPPPPAEEYYCTRTYVWRRWRKIHYVYSGHFYAHMLASSSLQSQDSLCCIMGDLWININIKKTKLSSLYLNTVRIERTLVLLLPVLEVDPAEVPLRQRWRPEAALVLANALRTTALARRARSTFARRGSPPGASVFGWFLVHHHCARKEKSVEAVPQSIGSSYRYISFLLWWPNDKENHGYMQYTQLLNWVFKCTHCGDVECWESAVKLISQSGRKSQKARRTFFACFFLLFLLSFLPRPPP